MTVYTRYSVEPKNLDVSCKQSGAALVVSLVTFWPAN